jgi:succinate dehydrogenase/fumarate reductase cytochrome b subunit
MNKIITLNLVASSSELLIFIVLDLLLLTVGIFHGLNGLYAVLVDCGLNKNAATFTVISLCTLSVVLLGVGSYALLQLI